MPALLHSIVGEIDWTQHGASAPSKRHAVAFFGSSQYDSTLDNNDQNWWPERFWGSNRGGMMDKTFKLLGLTPDGNIPGRENLNPQVLLAHHEAVKAANDAESAAKAAKLSFERDRDLPAIINASVNAWRGASQAAKVDAAQAQVLEAVKDLQKQERPISKLLREGLKIAKEGLEVQKPWQRQKVMARAREEFKKAEELFPKVDDVLSKTHVVQKKLDVLMDESEPPHGLGLFPPGGPWPEAARDAGPGGPEAEIKDLEPDEPTDPSETLSLASQ